MFTVSACFDDWACCLLLCCCNKFLTKLALLLRAALYSFFMESVNFCFRFLKPE
jgi:hypothetical protein